MRGGGEGQRVMQRTHKCDEIYEPDAMDTVGTTLPACTVYVHGARCDANGR